MTAKTKPHHDSKSIKKLFSKNLQYSLYAKHHFLGEDCVVLSMILLVFFSHDASVSGLRREDQQLQALQCRISVLRVKTNKKISSEQHKLICASSLVVVAHSAAGEDVCRSVHGPSARTLQAIYLPSALHEREDGILLL